MLFRKFSGPMKHGTSHVYVISCGQFCKVGMAVNVDKRFSMLQCGNPHEMHIELVAEVCKKRARECECLAHGELSDYHHRKEWFRVPVKKAKRAVIQAVQRYEDRKPVNEMTEREIEIAYEEALGMRSPHRVAQ